MVFVQPYDCDSKCKSCVAQNLRTATGTAGTGELGIGKTSSGRHGKDRLKDWKTWNPEIVYGCLWFIEIEIGFGWFGDEHSSRFDIFIGYCTINSKSHGHMGMVTNNFMGIPVQWDITDSMVYSVFGFVWFWWLIIIFASRWLPSWAVSLVFRPTQVMTSGGLINHMVIDT